MKRIKITVVILLCVAVMIQGCFFFGLFGKLGFVYLPKRVNTESVTDSGLVDPKEITSITIYDYKDFLKVRNSLKYCDKLLYFALDIYPDKRLKDIDFLECFPKIESIVISGESDDWSGISECKNITQLTISNSNFSDLNYLKNLDKLNFMEIHTNSHIICTEQVNLNLLDILSIEAPSLDISCFNTAINVTVLAVKSKNIYNYDEIRNMNCLKHLRFIGTDIDIENLKIISEIDSLEELDLTECVFSVGEEQLKNVLSSLYERKAEVKINDCEFRE